MKFLVIGASGLVGSHVMSAALEACHDVVGTTRSATVLGLKHLELSDSGATVRMLEREAPDIVVYAAGWTWVDGCEGDKERSLCENFEQPLAVARWCARRGVRILYYSSSYVFDGAAGSYVEDDRVSPINVYGRHKADAEKAILDISGGKALVARLICVWGKEFARKNFVYQVIRTAESGNQLVLPADQCGNPTWAGDIAHWTICLAEESMGGIWHLAGDSPNCTRVEWAQSILVGLSPGCAASVSIKPMLTSELGQRAPRPLLAGMLSRKVQGFRPRICRASSNLAGLFT